jgi:phosphoribosylanthranilate isomerase
VADGLRVKICGLTVPEEAIACAAAGAWAVGVVFAPESTRRVAAGQAAEVLAGLPGHVARVGVFVDAATAELARTAHVAGLTHLQLHGAADVEAAIAATGLPVILGRPFDGPPAARRPRGAAELVLFDAAVPGRHGGTGRRLDWTALAAEAPERPFGLAGGLSPANVADAVRAVRPDLVDVSSGVESAPGRKDPARVAEFIRAAQEAWAGTTTEGRGA